MAEFKHTTVLLNETVSNLNINPDGVYVDCTLGGGGHSELILSTLSKNGRLIGIDQDTEAICAAKKRLEKFGDRFIPCHSNFENIKDVLNSLNISKVNGIIADLGVSSYQLDNAERGFSFMADSDLDMRMNQDDKLSAYDVVNTYTEEKLTDILFDYGEEKWAKRIARFIVKERENKPISTTFELVEVIKKAVPKGARQEGKHPATRTFQAIRIEVNHELDVLKHALDDFCDLLEKGGRVCIITFHSLEDRLVKNTFKDLCAGCTCPKDFPVCVCGNTPKAKIVTRKPVLPSDEEIEFNPRSRSAKLRVIEKI